MASVLNKTQQQLEAEQAAKAAQTTSANTVTPAAADDKNTVAQTTVASGNTANSKLNQYSMPYQQGASVQAAQQYLNGVLNNKPVADANLSALYDKIMNREQFSYDLNGDALYQQYKDKYQTQGKQAMMDTMGNASALTGGYGSSYASTAGNQAYQQWLQQLNDVVPDLYNAAYNRYQQEGNDLMNQYNMAYGQYRDQVGDWETERNYAANDYWQQYDADYNAYLNAVNQYYTERDYAHSLVMAMIQKKQMPSAELLAAAGLTEADAIKLGAKKPGSGGGSSKKKSSSGGGTQSASDATIPDSVYRRALDIYNRSGSADTYNEYIENYILNQAKKQYKDYLK